jgi:hypothetical protein
MHGHRNGWTDIWTDGQTLQIDRRYKFMILYLMIRQTDGQTDGGMNRQMDKQMYRQIYG